MLVTFMDLIEQQDGTDARDAWIHLLPVSATHCFDCGSWPDDSTNGIPELAQQSATEVPERWKRLIPLLEPMMREVSGM